MKNFLNGEKPPADKLYSQYWWIISLNPSHPQNNPNVNEMHGYSKFQGHDEMQDKEFLLMKKILMLATRGYISRSKMIKIFFRRDTIINKKSDPEIVILYPKTFVLAEKFMQVKYSPLQIFLTKLYQQLSEGKKIDNLLPKRKSSFSKDDFLDISKLNFVNEGQLNNYCTRLIRNGHSFIAVTSFQKNYLERKPFKI